MTLSQSIRDVLVTFSAVTALVPAKYIRPDERMQTDPSPGITIEVVKKLYDNDLSGQTTLVGGTFLISSCSGKKIEAEAIAEAVRSNGTVPGTGLAGCSITTGDLPFQAMLTQDTYDYMPIKDGSNTGWFLVDSLYSFTCNQTV